MGSLIELPLGLVAGDGKLRHWLVIAGGAVVMASLAAVAAGRSVTVLMVAFVAFFPASGAFVSLSQAALMDASPGRHQQRMAAWNLSGSAGAVGGPLLLAGVLAAGGGWRSAYLLLAAAAGAAVAAAAFAGPARKALAVAGRAGEAEQPGQEPAADTGKDEQPGRKRWTRWTPGRWTPGRWTPVREALGVLREGEVARWVVLLEISDLLLDVLTGYIAIYLVDVVKVSPAEAAAGVAVRLGAGLAGDALFVLIARRVSGPAVLRASAALAAAAYPAFLIVPSLPAKLAILAALSLVTACWYPVIQAGLYTSLPGRSGVAVFLSSAAGLLGAAGPLAVGLLAQQAGLTWAMAVLAAAPAAVLAALPRPPGRRSHKVKR